MFIQHVFPPLGFIPNHYYNDNMVLSSSSSVDCYVLSPCPSTSVVSFTGSRFRSWSPLANILFSSVFSVSSFASRKSPFLFSCSSENFDFIVKHLVF